MFGYFFYSSSSCFMGRIRQLADYTAHNEGRPAKAGHCPRKRVSQNSLETTQRVVSTVNFLNVCRDDSVSRLTFKVFKTTTFFIIFYVQRIPCMYIYRGSICIRIHNYNHSFRPYNYSYLIY